MSDHAEVLRELLHLSRGLFPLEKLAIRAAIEALTHPQPVTPAGGEVEPVAWRVASHDSTITCYAEATAQAQAFELRRGGYPATITPLYTHPPVADAALLGAFVASILSLEEDYIGDVDGGTLQDHAEKYGLLQATEVTEACGEGCNCASYGDFPQTCYRATKTMRRAIAALNQRGGGE